MSFLRGFRKDETGAAMVEFAIVFAFLFLPLLFGAIEFGRATMIKSAVTAAAREGVRYAVVHGSESGALPSDTANISAAIMARTKISPLAITTTYDPANNNDPGSKVQVRVTYAYTPVINLFQATLGNRTVRIPFLSARDITSTSKQIIHY